MLSENKTPTSSPLCQLTTIYPGEDGRNEIWKSGLPLQPWSGTFKRSWRSSRNRSQLIMTFTSLFGIGLSPDHIDAGFHYFSFANAGQVYFLSTGVGGMCLPKIHKFTHVCFASLLVFNRITFIAARLILNLNNQSSYTCFIYFGKWKIYN